MNKIYITTPIYYVNSEPHVGSAYTTLYADMMSRFYKLDNYDVKFLTGTDEHGQKIEQSAKKVNKDPQIFVDEVSQKFKDLIELMDYQPTQFDTIKTNFIRTTYKVHKDYVQDVWQKLIENDWLYIGKYTGWYCVSDEAYYDETELIKGEDGIYRTSLGKTTEWREEETYFFRLSEFQKILLQIYEKYPNFIQPEDKKGEIISFVSGLTLKEYKDTKKIKENYLKDLSVSRNNFNWGIKISYDINHKKLLDDNKDWIKDIKDNEKHIIYVWFDALFNYLTSLGAPNYKDYKNYWLENENKIHLVGKDILRPHAVYWPAFLIAYNYTREEVKNMTELPKDIMKYLPTTLFAHGWLTNEGQKISKSLGNAIIPSNEIKWLQDEFNIDINIARDYLKYYLITVTIFGNDGDYSKNRFVEKINNDLANKIGNLTKRCLDMIYKNFDKKIPKVDKFDDILFLNFKNCEEIFKKFNFDLYINEIIKYADIVNKYIEDKEPWNLRKENKIEELKIVLYSSINAIRKIAILLQPIIPYISSMILKEIGEKTNIFFNEIDKNIENNNINEPTIIIPRLQHKK